MSALVRTIVVGVGSNIQREKHACMAVACLAKRFGALRISPVYESVSVGFDGPDFYNFVIAFEAKTPLPEVISHLKAIEAQAGREHGEKKYSSRTLDIDVLLVGDEDLRAEQRNIPRDEIISAAYVLKPLADLLPDASCALLDESFSLAWARFEAAESNLGIRQVEIDLYAGCVAGNANAGV